MISQGLKSAAVLGGLCVLLVIVGLWGFNAATEPFPGKTDAPKCVATPVSEGDKVFPAQVTVSVYNASQRNGLASRTMGLFRDAGFNAGDTGNAPKDTEVDVAAIWTDQPDNPAVRLVASRLGPEVRIEERDGRGAGVMVLVGDRFEALAKGVKRVVAEQDTRICSPPVS